MFCVNHVRCYLEKRKIHVAQKKKNIIINEYNVKVKKKPPGVFCMEKKNIYNKQWPMVNFCVIASCIEIRARLINPIIIVWSKRIIGTEYNRYLRRV